MKKFDILKMHETFTDESNSVILIEDLLKNIDSLSNEEKNELLKQVLLCSEDENKLLEQEKVSSENFYKNRENSSTIKRKVISVKKVTKNQKEFLNDTIKNHKETIEKLVKLNLDDFKVYVLELDDKANINYYLLGLIKERMEYQKMIDEAYLSRDVDLMREINGYMSEIEEKIEFLKSLQMEEEVVLETNEKCRIIFLETSSLRSYFLEDIDGLEEFYDSFAKLLVSIENGNPYKAKTLVSNGILKGVEEAKDIFGQTRIFYDKIDANTYIVINSIIKKHANAKDYIIQLKDRYKKYLQQKDYILIHMNDEDFICRQEQHLIEAKEVLGIEQVQQLQGTVNLRKNLGGGV